MLCSNRQGRFELWLQALEGSRPAGSPRKLTDHPGSTAAPSYSPDGRFIAYFRVHEGLRDIWIVPVSGGVPERFTDDPASDVEPAFSPDGAWVAFISNRDGRDHVWVAPVKGGRAAGPARQLTRGETADRHPGWSPDGKRVTYIAGRAESSDLWTVPLDGSAPPAPLTRGAMIYDWFWEPSGSSVLVSGRFGGGSVELRRLDLASGRIGPAPGLDVFGPSSQEGVFSLSADGRTLAYVAEEARGYIWLLEGPQGSF